MQTTRCVKPRNFFSGCVPGSAQSLTHGLALRILISRNMDSIPCPYSYGPSLLIVNVIIIERYSVVTEMAFVFCGGPYTIVCPGRAAEPRRRREREGDGRVDAGGERLVF